jgi:Negative regulator of sigma F
MKGAAMQCNDLDQLRAKSPSSKASTWPMEAQEHLASCSHCSHLQAVFESSEPTEFPAALQSRIEAAILPGLKPVSPLPNVWRITAALFFCAAAVVAVADWQLGVAGWLARTKLQVSVDFTLLGISMLVVALALAKQMAPGSQQAAPAWAFIVGPLLVLLGAVFLLFGYRWIPNFWQRAFVCWEIGIACAALSTPLFWLVLRRGFSLTPVRQGAMTGLLAGFVGVTVLEIHCPNLDRMHIADGHIGAAVTAVLVGAALSALVSKTHFRSRQPSI